MKKHSLLPAALLARLERQFGKQTRDDIVAAVKFSRPTTFRANTILSDNNEVMERLREDKIAFERIKGIPHAFAVKNITGKEMLAHPLCLEGKIYLQGLSSMIPPLVLEPQPGETVLDLCAAPGSKTSQMAAMMKNRGSLVAMESDRVRFEKLKNTIDQQQAKIVEPIFGDAALLCRRFPETFDKILADVPCSAEGRITLSNPRTYRYWSEKNISKHAKIQRRLLRAAVAALKPGGRLVYSTCTLAPQENEEMTAWLSSEFRGMRLEPVRLPLPAKRVENGCYLLPNRQHEGLFVSKMLKRKDSR